MSTSTKSFGNKDKPETQRIDTFPYNTKEQNAPEEGSFKNK